MTASDSLEHFVAELAIAAKKQRHWILAVGWLIAIIGGLRFGLALLEAVRADGGRAVDARSYWLAGERVLHNLPLYADVRIGDLGAYRYTPTFAVLTAPLSLLPELVFTWAYRIACLLCLRYLVGSWLATGCALLLPPVSIELIALNVTLPIAALGRWSLRGSNSNTAPMLLAFATSVKYGSVFLLPFLWLRRPANRRPLLFGTAVVVAVTVVHIAAAPQVWGAFVRSIAEQSQSVNNAPFVGNQLLFLVPSTLGDFLVRLAIATAMTAIAINRGWTWLVFTAATIAVPTLWLARLAPLVGVPRLAWEDWRDRQRRGREEESHAPRSQSIGPLPS
jgi:hypothetical protein